MSSRSSPPAAEKDQIQGDFAHFWLLGQCNSSDKSESFGVTLVVVAASSEALAWLTKVKCEM